MIIHRHRRIIRSICEEYSRGSTYTAERMQMQAEDQILFCREMRFGEEAAFVFCETRSACRYVLKWDLKKWDLQPLGDAVTQLCENWGARMVSRTRAEEDRIEQVEKGVRKAKARDRKLYELIYRKNLSWYSAMIELGASQSTAKGAHVHRKRFERRMRRLLAPIVQRTAA